MTDCSTDCPITRNMPVGAFIVFVGSFFIFLYILSIDYNETRINEQSKEETIWIGIFFIMLLSCVIVALVCIVKSNKYIGKKVNSIKKKYWN